VSTCPLGLLAAVERTYGLNLPRLPLVLSRDEKEGSEWVVTVTGSVSITVQYRCSHPHDVGSLWCLRPVHLV
jgi:hypothetical protein